MGSFLERWGLMISSVESHRAELPEMAGNLDLLKNSTADVVTKNNEQEELKGQLKVKTRDIKQTANQTDRIYAAMVRQLQAKYGPNAPELNLFISSSEAKVHPTKTGWAKEPEKK
jgi:hypothetical protein